VYGAVRGVTGTPTSKHAFVASLGHPSEDETGLIYMRARYCDPQIGRFASEDPALHGKNWFEYCFDNPICFRDRTGKDGEGGVGGEVVVIGASEDVAASLDCALEAAIEKGFVTAETTLEGPVGMIGSGAPTAETGWTLARLADVSKVSVTEWIYMCREVAGAGGQIFKAWIGWNAQQIVAFAIGEGIVDHVTPIVGSNMQDISWW